MNDNGKVVVVTGFDYTAVAAGVRKDLQQFAADIKTMTKRAARDVLDTGKLLLAAKEMLPHGQFQDWVEIEFGMEKHTAERFMNVARQFKSNNLSLLNYATSALYALSAPSVPEEARQEAQALAETGATVTHATAKQIIASHKPAPEPQNDDTVSAFSPGDADEQPVAEAPAEQPPPAPTPLPGSPARKPKDRDEPPPALMDLTGYRVPKCLFDIFRGASEHLTREAKDCRRRANEALRGFVENPWIAAKSRETLARDCQVHSDIYEAARPWAVCRSCRGKGVVGKDERCQKCRAVGWLPRWAFEEQGYWQGVAAASPPESRVEPMTDYPALADTPVRETHYVPCDEDTPPGTD